VLIRGLSSIGLALRPQVRIVEGRMFQPGLREIAVSRSISKRFKNTALGDKLRFGRGEWTVVGIFEAGRTAFDSEIWADVNQIASDYNRPGYSSVLLRATDETAVRQLKARIAEDQRVRLNGQREIDYYAEQTKTAGPIKFLGMFMAITMAIGACFAAMNTMYAAVANRTREIATMRVIGFKRGSILLAFLFESLLLALIGGLVGCLLSLPVNGLSTGTTNFRTFSEVTFDFRITPGLLLDGMIFAAFIGILGGLLPARQAARQEMVVALRD
jgi:putative ABC transport system permease protein